MKPSPDGRDIPCPPEITSDHGVLRVRGITDKDVAKLATIGIFTYEQLAETDPAILRKSLRWSGRKPVEAVLHAKALTYNRYYQKANLKLPDGVIYFYDIETLGTMTYLHGVIRMTPDGREERSFLARNLADEGVAWREFLDYLSQDDEAIVYSWTNYERGFVHKLWDDYRGNPAGWKHLKENLEDQCALMKNHFALPTRSYGLKCVAPLFGFNWHAPHPSGRLAEIWYRQWLEFGDEAALREVVEYNLDDVRAMEVIHHGINFIL